MLQRIFLPLGGILKLNIFSKCNYKEICLLSTLQQCNKIDSVKSVPFFRNYSDTTDEMDEVNYKRLDVDEAPASWPTSLYAKVLNPSSNHEQPPQAKQCKVIIQPPKLDWRTDRSYRKVMGVMGGLAWKEGNISYDHRMLSFSPSDESNYIRHFKPLI